MKLVPCIRCNRHVGVSAMPREASRPSPSRSAPIGRMSRAAVFAGLGACWTTNTTSKPPPPPPPAQADAAVVQSDKPAGEAHTITGKVTDAGTNTPLANVSVELRNEHGRVVVTMTDEAGRYMLAEVATGDYQLVFTYATHMERGSAQRPVLVRGDKPLHIDVGLRLATRAPMAKPYGAPPARSRIV